MNLIKKLDQFGIKYQPTVQSDEKEFKSIFGGIASIILYSLSLAYFIYKLCLWGSGDILPKISSSQSTQNYEEIDFDYDPLFFQVVGMGEGDFIDPFAKTNNIITPSFQYIDGIQVSNNQPLLDSSVPSLSSKISSTITPQNVSLILNQEGITDSSPKNQKQLLILFEVCNSTKYSNCADQEQINKFLSQPLNMFFISIQMRQFNVKQQKFEPILKQLYFFLDGTTTLYTQILFSITTSIRDTGFFLQSLSSSKYVSNFQATTQQLPQSGFQNVFNGNFLGVFLIGIDTLSTTQQITYPKLGEILADVGSIMSTLLLLKIFVVIINSILLEEQVLNKVIGFYYPEFNKAIFNKSIFGKIKSININGRMINSKDFFQFYFELQQKAREKLTVTNQIYEISRLQFLIHSMMTRKIIKLSHGIGITLQEFSCQSKIKQIEKSLDCKDIKNDKGEELIPIQPQQIEIIPVQETIVKTNMGTNEIKIGNDEILNDEDYTLLSLSEHKRNQIKEQEDILTFFQLNNQKE